MSKAYCKMIKDTYTLKEGTKGVWVLSESETNDLTENQYNNITSKESMSFFRRLGGSETADRCYTCKGYNVYKLTSKSPSRDVKVIRTFDFEV